MNIVFSPVYTYIIIRVKHIEQVKSPFLAYPHFILV